MIKSYYWVLRTFFVLLLLATATGKMLDIVGFSKIIATYQLPIPESLLLPTAVAIALFELLLGLSILFGLRLYVSAILLIMMHIAYTLLAIITKLRGIAIDNCGCFGIYFGRPMTWGTVIEDSILVLLSVSFLFLIKKKNLLTK